jgi:RNA polymerase sigma-70 factor (ECF subfamily)
MLEALYRRLAPDVFRFALRLTGDRALADDLAAEAFAVALAGPARVEPGSARALLFGTVRNLHLHERRARARRPSAPDGALARLAGPGADPERMAGARGDLARALADLQALPEESRAALLLRAEGLAYEEIAAALKTSAGAAKVRVHRARAALAARRVARAQKDPPEGGAP